MLVDGKVKEGSDSDFVRKVDDEYGKNHTQEVGRS